MKSGRGVLLAALAGSIVTACVVGGIAWASIPAGDKTISGCYDLQSGQVRIYDPDGGPIKGCGKNEGKVTWNQTGPKGDPGPTGDPGLAGISHAYHVSSQDRIELSGSYVTVLTLNLPAGDYVVSGKTSAMGVGGGFIDCRLAADLSTLDQASTPSNTSVGTFIALEATAHQTVTSAVTLECAGNSTAFGSHLIATAVNAVN